MNVKDYQFKAILHGMFGAITVTKRLRDVWDAIKAIDARLTALETADSAETVADEGTQTIAEPVVAEEPEPEEPAGFNWQTCDDAQDLKEFALTEFNLEIKGNKRADTIRNEIEGYLESLTEG